MCVCLHQQGVAQARGEALSTMASHNASNGSVAQREAGQKAPPCVHRKVSESICASTSATAVCAKTMTSGLLMDLMYGDPIQKKLSTVYGIGLDVDSY